MAIQLLPQHRGLAEILGENLGTGLQSLASSKVQNLQQRAQAGALQSLIQGSTPEQGQAFSSLSPQNQSVYLKELLKQPNQQAYANAISSTLNGGNLQQPTQAGLNPQQALEIAKLGLQQQQQIESRNAPVLKKIEEQAVAPRKIKSLAEEALKTLKTGKAITGLTGRITPAYLQSEEGQRLNTLLNDIVIQRAQLGKGLPTVARLKLEQGAKAQIWQQPKVIESILNDIINDKEINRDIARDMAREEILTANNGNQPRNLDTLINNRSKEILRDQRKSEKEAKPSEFTELPSGSQYEGKIATNPDTGERKQMVGGKWVNI